VEKIEITLFVNNSMIYQPSVFIQVKVKAVWIKIERIKLMLYRCLLYHLPLGARERQLMGIWYGET